MTGEVIKFISIPVMCQGFIAKRTPEDEQQGIYQVLTDGPAGVVPSLPCKLCYTPGSQHSYRIGMPVMVMVECTYSIHQEKTVDIVYDGRHIIMGTHDPFSVKPRVKEKNVNADLMGNVHKMLHPVNHAGVVVEENGAVNIVTNGTVKRRLSPGGEGFDENSDISQAQNYMRVIANTETVGYRAREYFGMCIGEGSERKKSFSDPTGKNIPIAYKRFVPSAMNPSSWVSTCEGAYSPWVGPNNGVNKIVLSDKEIIFSKVVHSDTAQSRLSVTAGKKGADFLNIRVDNIISTLATPPETMSGEGPQCVPPTAFAVASISIGSDGDVLAEFGIDKAKNAAVSIKISKDGEVEVLSKKSVKITSDKIDVVTNEFTLKSDKIVLQGDVEIKGAVKAGGKNLATADVVDYLVSKLPTMYTSVPTGGPCIPNPAAIAELTAKSSAPGQMKSNPVPVPSPLVIVSVSATPPLKST
jgi:hypothetical protein